MLLLLGSLPNFVNTLRISSAIKKLQLYSEAHYLQVWNSLKCFIYFFSAFICYNVLQQLDAGVERLIYGTHSYFAFPSNSLIFIYLLIIFQINLTNHKCSFLTYECFQIHSKVVFQRYDGDRSQGFTLGKFEHFHNLKRETICQRIDNKLLSQVFNAAFFFRVFTFTFMWKISIKTVSTCIA